MIGSVAWILIGVALGLWNTVSMIRTWRMIRSGDRAWLTRVMFTLCVITGPGLLLYVFFNTIV